MTNVDHPAKRNALIFRRSRSTFPSRLPCQNDAFVAGTTAPYLHLCTCQKQPLTKTVFLSLGKNEIRSAGKMSHMKSKAITQMMSDGPDKELGPRILPANT